MNDSLATLLGEIFAGLGLFFVGIKLIGGNLQQMTSRTVRDRLRRAVDTPVRGALLGIVAGALTQSTNAVTFIMTSMNAAGLLTIARAAPVVIWANVGTSALVLVATVDLRLPIFYVLGLIGLLYFFDVEKSDRFRHPAAALLGLALLFLGLMLIKSGAAPLKEMQAVRTLLEIAATSYGLVFLVGMSITLVVQSSVTVSTIAVAMVHSGLLSMEQTALVIYGSGLGAAISLWFMTANLHGSSRQLAYLQILLKLVATALLLALFVLEHLLQRDYLLSTLAHFSSQLALQGALVFLVYQCAGAVVMTASRTAMLRRIARWAPANNEETLATPHYLYEQALDDVPSALDLVGKEQARLVSMLPRYVSAADLRNPSPALGAGLSVRVLYRVNREVRQQVEQFLTDLMNSNSDRLACDQILNCQTRNRLIADLQEGLYQLNEVLTHNAQLNAQTVNPRLLSIQQAQEESMHFILLTLQDAVEHEDADAIDMLRQLTSDRAETMDRLRKNIFQEGADFTHQVQEALFAASTLFERIVWIVRQYSMLLAHEDLDADAKASSKQRQVA